MRLVFKILHTQSRFCARPPENIRIFVFAYTADVENTVLREDVLRAASGVLGGAAGNQFGVVVLEEFFVDAHVLGLGEDRIIGFEVILPEKALVSAIKSWSVWVRSIKGLRNCEMLSKMVGMSTSDEKYRIPGPLCSFLEV
jgi:hypothetical protein